MPLILKSLIQSDFRDGSHGNFEAVVALVTTDQGPLELWHYWHDNSDTNKPWQRGQRVSANVAAAGSIIQSDFRSGDHGNFEVVVPLFATDGTMELWHSWHDNSDVSKPWQQGQRIATNVAGAGCIIQSDFVSGGHGNFEVVVPVVSATGGIDLWHYWHDNSDVNKPWQQGQRVAANVSGPGTIIQSDFQAGTHGNFEVVVPVPAGDGSTELWHFWHDNSDVNKPWQRGQRIAQYVTGSGVIIQSDFRSGDHGNFEVVVPVSGSLVHFFHDNSDVNNPWQRGQNITDVARGWGCIVQSDFISDGHGNFEVLVPECSQSLIHYWHPNQNVAYPWLRGLVLIGEPYPARVTGATKVVQLTGEYDREGWNGIGTPNLAFNHTESAFGIRGCDLGSSFEHNDRAYFLFGDTWRVNQTPAELNLDCVAFTTDTDPTQGVHLTFNSQPPLVVAPSIDQGGFNVPVDGTSWNGSMYVFFTTGSFQIDDSVTLMGWSVLARSTDEGYNFVNLGVFSRQKFINVSVEQGTVDDRAASMLTLPRGTPVLWIWGTGRYRASAVYLAVMPLATLETLQGIQYYAGGSAWSKDENDAIALVSEGDVGELSVRWNPFLARWLLLFNSGNPRGILMHSAPSPWGPWSPDAVMIFDPTPAPGADPCSGAGYGKFMHAGYQPGLPHCDHVQDNMFPPFAFRDGEWGGEYGPYQITRYTGTQKEIPQIWFTMSTWNPYQSMLMQTLIPKNFV
jgi:Domain of unknown function (DUF4185)